MNVGFQREIRHGMMISADYVRNVETHGLLGVDVNHAGSTRYFNRNGALNAIAPPTTISWCPVLGQIRLQSTAPSAPGPQLGTTPAMA